MNKTELAAALGWNEKNLWARFDALGLLVVCTRCGGSGHYSYNYKDGTKCFGCGGTGKGMPRPSKALVAQAQAKVAAGELAPYLADCARKAEARKAIKPMVARIDAAIAAQCARYTAASDASRREGGEELPAHVYAAQHLAMSIRFGYRRSTRTGGEVGPSDYRQMGAAQVETAVQYHGLGPLEAVARLAELVDMAEQIEEAFAQVEPWGGFWDKATDRCRVAV